MNCFLLQDDLCVSSDAGVATIIQPEWGWLDLAGFLDLVAFAETTELDGNGVGSSVQIAYQTAAAKDEALFVDAGTATLSVGLVTTVMLKDTAQNPLMRWLRWKLTDVNGSPSGTWEASFRVWVAASRPGRRFVRAGRTPSRIAAVSPPASVLSGSTAGDGSGGGRPAGRPPIV